MTIFRISAAGASAYPDAHMGMPAMHEVANPPYHPELEEQKAVRVEAMFMADTKQAPLKLPIYRLP